jgi:hypothetical protein
LRSDWDDPHLLEARERAKDDATVTWTVIVFCGAIVLYFAGWDLLGTLTERACLKAGYTAGRVTATYGRYCTARVDGSDVTLPLDEARRRPRR